MGRKSKQFTKLKHVVKSNRDKTLSIRDYWRGGVSLICLTPFSFISSLLKNWLKYDFCKFEFYFRFFWEVCVFGSILFNRILFISSTKGYNSSSVSTILSGKGRLDFLRKWGSSWLVSSPSEQSSCDTGKLTKNWSISLNCFFLFNKIIWWIEERELHKFKNIPWSLIHIGRNQF